MNTTPAGIRRGGWRTYHRWFGLLAALATLGLGGCIVVGDDVAAGPAHMAERSVRHSFAAGEVAAVRIANLAGTIVLEGSGADGLAVEATVHGGGESEGEAEEIARLLEVAAERAGDVVAVTARYPVDEHAVYHYPPRDDAGVPRFLAWLGGSRTRTRYQGRRVSVVSARRSGSVTLFVDFVVRVPEGVSVTVDNKAGRIRATDVRGPVTLDTGAGGIEVSGGVGRLEVDTGSGSVEIVDHGGSVTIDTGSGGVEARRVRGTKLGVDTGSGHVTIVDVECDTIHAETGSGGIDLERVRGAVEVDTGSGSIRGDDLRVAGRLYADTGSGGVRLSGDMAAAERIGVDTGSGSVRLEMNGVPEMRIRISTGSGGIDVDVPDLRVVKSGRSHFEGEVGSGRIPVAIDTGSGGVTVRGRPRR